MYHMMTDEEFDRLSSSEVNSYVFLLPSDRYGFWDVKSFDPKFSHYGIEDRVELDPDDDFAVFSSLIEAAGLKISWLEDPTPIFEVYEFIYKTFDYPGLYFPMKQKEADLLLRVKKAEVDFRGEVWYYSVPGEWFARQSPTKSRKPSDKEYKEFHEFLDKQSQS